MIGYLCVTSLSKLIWDRILSNILLRSEIVGQAKLRGKRESRVSAAMKKIDALKPDHIVCNNCHSKLMEIATLDTRGLKEIEAAFVAHCSACNHDTWAIRGDPDAVADLFMALEGEIGHEGKIGVATATKALP
jgi:hypothetical protein